MIVSFVAHSVRLRETETDIHKYVTVLVYIQYEVHCKQLTRVDHIHFFVEKCKQFNS